MHRNTFLNSPELLNSFYQLKANPNIYFAGQMNGVEGYVESAASGLLCGIHAARTALEEPPVDFPNTTAIGALAHYVSDESIVQFQPMNVNFGIMAPPDFKFRGKRDKNAKLAERSLSVLDALIGLNNL
jgi:methylenetetrahydrofolate--tRNA-(uracil-5-)-methyltransferase